jgi:hypothetical protein
MHTDKPGAAETQRNAKEYWDADLRGFTRIKRAFARSAGPCGASKCSADLNAFVDPSESAQIRVPLLLGVLSISAVTELFPGGKGRSHY